MLHEDHANTMFRSVIRNFIFAGWRLVFEVEKILVARFTLAMSSHSLNAFFRVLMRLDHQTRTFPELIQIPEMGLEGGIKVLKTLIIVPPLLTF